ncbi:MGMT family protein [Synechococcus sp. RSCCF101]|uniref:MGMT family protein n=1 Tax=Synechococcus sp. RSCCF101 TaxID=2511069 RepID=UPI001CD9A53E|nr:MGMT family protein [Synechococcus sp. RSCCF101]
METAGKQGHGLPAGTATQRFYAVTRLIPFGRLLTYGRVAELAGHFGAARQVGWALRRLPDLDTVIPWHRVVNARGCISLSESREGSDWLQRQLLIDEGIAVDGEGRLNLRRHLWTPDPSEVVRLLEAGAPGPTEPSPA